MNFECILSVFFNLQKSTLNAICGVPEHLAILLFVFDLNLDAICGGRSYFEGISSNFLTFRSCLRCLTLTLFVVAGHTFGGHCFSSMLDSDAICRGRRYF